MEQPTEEVSVAQRRIQDQVGDLGVIETGLPASKRSPSSRSLTVDNVPINRRSNDKGVVKRIADSIVHRAPEKGESVVGDNKSLGTEDVTRPGRIILKKCEAAVPSSSLLNRLYKNREGRKKTILHSMRVDVPAGSITAILGTSESGKSTLLKFMAGCMDKNMAYDGIVNLQGSTSYLPRETNLHRFYTPRTYIRHYDRLLSSRAQGGGCNNMPNRFKRNQSSDSNGDNGGRPPMRRTSSIMTHDDVENLLDNLRIDHERRDTIVGDVFRRGLSPGEQRRLELGLLVLGAPDTLFCENPVEGLDSETSLQLMEFLKGYSSNSSRRVIVTLNRPSLFVWNLIDNVILLSRGRIVFEGPRFDMESFFSHHKMPTPARFSPLEHYLAVVNNFRRPNVSVDWESAFKKWQEEGDDDNEDGLADDIETCFPTAIPNVMIPSMQSRSNNEESSSCLSYLCCCFGKWSPKFIELLRRYLLQMALNPGILQLRFGMYTMLSLILGMLFFNLEQDFSYQQVNSHAALLFYSSSFYIFMVVAILPFLAIDHQIKEKEVLNGFYHPITHHLAVSVAAIPTVFIMSLVISVILVNMVQLENGIMFFLILTLALWCGESLAILVSLCTKNYILGIVGCAGVSDQLIQLV
eukprot:g357.t1.1.5e174188 g357  g357.t1 contig1:864473-866633(+)